MPQANAPQNATRRDELPLAGRSMELRNFARAGSDSPDGGDAPLATASMVFTTGAGVQRYDWYRERVYVERLVVEPGAIRLDRLQRGAPLLNTHNSWDLEAQLGVVENPAIANGEGTCDVTFSRRDSVAGYVRDVEDRIIRNVSVGYVRHRVEMVPPAKEGGMWEYRVVDWEPYEVSLVPIPADMDSQVRAAGGAAADEQHALRTFPCEFIETRAQHPESPTVGITAATSTRKENPMPGSTAAGGTTAPATTDETQRAAPAGTTVVVTAPAQDEASRAAVQAEQQRSADITELCQRHAVPHLAAGMIRANQTIDQARSAVLEEIARNDAAAGGHRNALGIQTVRDEMQTRLAGLEQAILHRVAANTQLDDNGRQYRGMSLLEMGREFLESHNVNTRGLSRLELATRMLTFRSNTGYMGTSDFSSLFANVASKRLRAAYEGNPGTYTMWARRAPNAPDFKAMSVVQLGAAPDLLQTNEHGEFKYGTLKDGAESYGVITYGRIVALTRQAIVNDDLRAFDRLVTAFGASARRLENRLVYSRLTANANLSDGIALFHASHNNLGTGAGSALQESSLQTMRTAMRLQKGLQGEELNLAPSYLIVPVALEQTAYKLTSSAYVPAKQSDINEFRAGGRTALEPIVEPVLDASSATAWYAAASSSAIDTVEYCYLEGAEGPVIESEAGFEVDGVSLKCRLDFAAKDIDFRGLYKAAGA